MNENTSRILILFVIIISTVLYGCEDSPKNVLYVNISADSGGDGRSWYNAYSNIQNKNQ